MIVRYVLTRSVNAAVVPRAGISESRNKRPSAAVTKAKKSAQANDLEKISFADA